MWDRLREMIRKEWRQALREPRMRVLLFLPPVIQLTIFGYAVSLDVERAPIAWMDGDRTPASRALRAAFEGSPHFRVVATPAREDEGRELLDRGRVLMLVRVLPGFAEQVTRGETAAVQILIEGTNSNTASILTTYATRVLLRYADEVMAERQQRALRALAFERGAPIVIPDLDVRTRVWFNPDLRSRNYFVPGVLVNIVAIVTLILTAMAIVRERELGTMEQLLVTPIRPVEFIIGKTVPFALIGLVDVVLVTSAALAFFRVPFRGSALVLLLGAILFILTTLGVGVFLSTISRTQQQAMLASFFFFMPAFTLSGFAFPIRNMPVLVQYLTYANPVRYFLEIVRGVFLKGTGLAVLWPQMVALSLLGAIVLGVSVWRFRQRLE